MFEVYRIEYFGKDFSGWVNFLFKWFLGDLGK